MKEGRVFVVGLDCRLVVVESGEPGIDLGDVFLQGAPGLLIVLLAGFDGVESRRGGGQVARDFFVGGRQFCQPLACRVSGGVECLQCDQVLQDG